MRTAITYIMITLLLISLAALGFYHLLEQQEAGGVLKSLIWGAMVILPISAYSWYQYQRGRERRV